MSQRTIGERLRRAREAIPASLTEAARSTRIRQDFLESMERDAFGFVSGKVYVKGMLRSYARWLGLDESEVLDDFDRLAGDAGDSTLAESLNLAPVMVPKQRRPHWVGAAAAAALILLALSFVGLMRPAGNVARPPRPPDSPEPTTTAPPAPGVVAQAPPQQAVVQGVHLAVTVVGDRCWVRVVSDGKEVFQGTLVSGDKRTFDAQDVLAVTFGALTAVRLQLNGRDLPVPAELGHVGTFEFRPDTTGLSKRAG